jgi:hypothetical protein
MVNSSGPPSPMFLAGRPYWEYPPVPPRCRLAPFLPAWKTFLAFLPRLSSPHEGKADVLIDQAQ